MISNRISQLDFAPQTQMPMNTAFSFVPMPQLATAQAGSSYPTSIYAWAYDQALAAAAEQASRNRNLFAVLN